MKNKEYYEVYYISELIGLRKLRNCDYGYYEKLFYMLDNKGFRVFILGKYILILPIFLCKNER